MRFSRAREAEVIATLRENPEAHIVFPERAYTNDERIRISRFNRRIMLHRYLFGELINEVPEGIYLLRSCDVTGCQNPFHYRGSESPHGIQAIGSDAVANAVKTHCVNGHPFTKSNTHEYRGKRICRACGRERSARRRANGEI